MIAMLLTEILPTASTVATVAAPAAGLGVPLGAYMWWREKLDAKRQAFLEQYVLKAVDAPKPGESLNTIKEEVRESEREKLWRKGMTDSIRQLAEDGEKGRKLQHQQMEQQRETIGILKTISDGIVSMNDKIEGLAK